MKDNDESKKTYVEPTLERREKLIEITEGAVVRVSGVVVTEEKTG